MKRIKNLILVLTIFLLSSCGVVVSKNGVSVYGGGEVGEQVNNILNDSTFWTIFGVLFSIALIVILIVVIYKKKHK